MAQTARRTLLIALAIAFVGVFLLTLLESCTRFDSGPADGRGSDDLPLAAGPDSFTIHGRFDVPLRPGASGGLDLELRNPSEENLTIRELEVSLEEIDAPNATLELPCSRADFIVEQSTGSVPLDAAQTATLSSLGWQPEQWPQIGMQETGVNQDGCKGASLVLDYTAVGEVRG